MKSREAILGTMLFLSPLVACATGPEQSNDWSAVGTVTEVDHDHVDLEDLRNVTAQGKAVEALADGKVTADDNYQDASCVSHETTDQLDELIDEGKITIGSVVKIRASIGNSTNHCVPGQGGFYSDRSMISFIQVVE